MKSKIVFLLAILFFCSSGFLFFYIKHKMYADVCGAKAIDWMKSQKLDGPNDKEGNTNLSLFDYGFFKLKKDDSQCLVLAIDLKWIPNNVYGRGYDDLYYFLFFKEEKFSQFYKYSLGEYKKFELVRLQGSFPNLLCVYDGDGDGEGEEGVNDRAHLFIFDGKTVSEVLVYNSYFNARQSDLGVYESKISCAGGRNLVVSYSGEKNDGSGHLNKVKDSVFYDWDSKLNKYKLAKGVEFGF